MIGLLHIASHWKHPIHTQKAGSQWSDKIYVIITMKPIRSQLKYNGYHPQEGGCNFMLWNLHCFNMNSTPPPTYQPTVSVFVTVLCGSSLWFPQQPKIKGWWRCPLFQNESFGLASGRSDQGNKYSIMAASLSALLICLFSEIKIYFLNDRHLILVKEI
jgi:hypothetical protein